MSEHNPAAAHPLASKSDAWSGRFNEPVADFVLRYTASVGFDRRLAFADIEGSLAHAAMLAHVGVLSAADYEAALHSNVFHKAQVAKLLHLPAEHVVGTFFVDSCNAIKITIDRPNLSASPDRPQYLRMKITLEIENTQIVEAIKPVMPRVIDTFQTHLRELRITDLEGSAGLFRLREELTRRVNLAIAPNRIRAVLFREIVVQ